MASRPIPDAALEQHVAVVGKTGSGKSYAAQGIVELLIHRRERVCIIDPTDRYWGLRLLSDGKKPSGFEPVIFGGQYADMSLSAAHGAAIAEIVGTTTTPIIIATRLMTVGERTRFFTDFAEGLLRKNEGPLHLVIDEAHLFMPQAGARVGGAAPAMLHAGNNLVSLGRGIGLRIMLLSQRPAKLHKDALTQVETLVSFRLIAPQDRNAIREWVREWADEATGAEMMTSLPSLPTGTAWVWAPELDVFQKGAFPTIVTYDSGKPLAIGRKGPALKPIDLADVRGKLATVAREAVENDPRRLKAKIAELERALKAATEFRKTTPDQTAIKEAARRGYERGVLAGRALVNEEACAVLNDLAAEIRAAEERAAARISAALRGEEAETDGTVVDRSPAPAEPSQPRKLRPPATPVAKPNGALPTSAGKMLAVLSRGMRLTWAQTATLAGLKARGGSFNTGRKALREGGYIVEDGDSIAASELGFEAAGGRQPKPTTPDEVIEWWRSMLPQTSGRVLDQLFRQGCRWIKKDRLAEFLGVAPRGGSWNTALSILRQNALIEVKGDQVRARAELWTQP